MVNTTKATPNVYFRYSNTEQMKNMFIRVNNLLFYISAQFI